MAERAAFLRILGEIFYRHWGAKIAAFVLAATLFVVTRDEVTRAFEVPLRVVIDPDRVLMTELPETIRLQIRGPWTRVNRLQDYDFDTATLDLKQARPGPLYIDPAGIVMPAGVVLQGGGGFKESGLQYDTVDIRFDEVVEKNIAITAPLSGTVAADYELVRVEVQPLHWRVRGGESLVAKLDKLVTESLPIGEATDDVKMALPVVPPPDGIRLVDAGPTATVKVRAIINPKQETRPYAVPLVVPDTVDPTGVVPRTYQVTVEGPLPDFRVLEKLSVTFPVEAKANVVERHSDGGGVVEVEFEWAEGVPEDVRRRLSYDHATERVTLPPPPPPPEPLDAAVPEEPE